MNDFNIEEFWQRIKRLCKEKKTTQLQLALDIGLTARSIQNQSMNNSVPQIDQAVKMAEQFGVSLDYLIMGDENNPLKKKVEQYEAVLKQIHETASA